MPGAYLEDVLKPGQTVNPLFSFLGVKVQAVSPEEAVLRLDFREEFKQGGGMVAGGILATLADEAMAHVVLANLGDGRRTATTEMNVRYFRPVQGSGLTARARVVHLGRSLISTEALVLDDRGRMVAKAGGSFFVIEPKKDTAPMPGQAK
jgi:uncharacterized protein (TIGR00369 family)